MSDWMEQLERLNELRKEGILSDAEFEAEKTALLPAAKPTEEPTEVTPTPSTQPLEGLPDTPSTSHKVNKVCPNCSVLAETEKSFCPECGTVYPGDSDAADTASVEEGDLLDRSQINNYVLALLVYGLLGFIGLFMEWFPGVTPGDLDSMVVTAVAYYLIFPLLSITLLLNAVGDFRKQLMAMSFMFPVFLILLSEVYSAFDLFFITPFRTEDYSVSYGDIVGQYGGGLWVALIGTIPVIVFMTLNITRFLSRSFLPSDFSVGSELRRRDSFIILGALLIALGSIYPELKPSPYFSDDFTPFADTFKANAEMWLLTGLLIPFLVLFAALGVARLENAGARFAALCGFFYFSLTSVFQVIAGNADTEYYYVWSIGATLIVIGMAVVGLVILSRYTPSSSGSQLSSNAE